MSFGGFQQFLESLTMEKLPCVVDMQNHQVGAVVFLAVRKIKGNLRQAAHYYAEISDEIR